MLLRGGFVLSVAPDVEQPSVNFRVQRLHATIHHLGETCMLADVFDHESRIAQGFGGAARGDEFNPGGGERLCEGNESCLVRNRNERA